VFPPTKAPEECTASFYRAEHADYEARPRAPSVIRPGDTSRIGCRRCFRVRNRPASRPASSYIEPMTFQLVALPEAPFAPLFILSDHALAAHGGVRRVADRSPGFPCRVSLRDAEPGDEVLLVNYEHQPARSPFRSTHAIYVRRGAVQVHLEPGEVPPMLQSRLLSVRAFDDAGMLLDAGVVEGREVERVVARLFDAVGVAYLHVHFARMGCYAARVDRA
jgi:Protein of unknown function (DUF1203)